MGLSMAPRVVRDVSYDFSGKVVLVTGGARGQGRAHALGFAAAGADVTVCDIAADKQEVPYALADAAELEAVGEEVRGLGRRCLAIACDVSEEEQVEAMVAATLEEFGHIDVLINNAGVISVHDIASMSYAAWRAVLDTNLGGAFLCSKYVAPGMIERRSGRILLTGSVESLIGLPRNTHYVAAKHGLVGLTRALALELAPHGIGVNVVCPGGIDTGMPAGLAASGNEDWFEECTALTGPWNLFDPESMMEPQEITHAMMWLASDAARFVTGVVLPVDGGFTIK
jgi:NAD(P)-dependent dehydrogenase (short-subunit alcohol dehydrogenase family)